MKLLEADFAQIEHINQIIYDNSSHNSWACFDTHLMLEARLEQLKKIYTSQTTINNNMRGTYNSSNPKMSRITNSFIDVRYDSFIVNITKLTNGYEYKFEIYNALWDGTYKISKSKNSASDPDEPFGKGNVVVSKDNTYGNVIIFTITGDDSDRVRICFHMNMNADGRNIQTTSLKIDNPKEYVHQYDVEVCEEGKITDEHGNPVSGVNVSIEPVDSYGNPITSGIKPRTVKDITNGKFKMCYSAVDVPGDYYVLMKVTGNTSYVGAETTQLIHIQKVQQESVFVSWGDPNQYKDVWKGSIKEYEIGVEVTNKFGVHEADLDKKLTNVIFTVTTIKLGDKRETQTCVPTKKSDGKYVLKPKCSYRGYYENTSRLEVELSVDSPFGNLKVERLVYHNWFKAEDYAGLLSEVNNEDGADWIFLYPKTYTSTGTLTITRPLTIAGLKGNQHCLINGSSKRGLIVKNTTADTDNYMQVNLLGIAFTNCENAVFSETGCLLVISRCYFYNNRNSNENHRGCSVDMKLTDGTINNQKLWKTEIKNSYFVNNRGNEIQSIGRTHIRSNLFKTTNKDNLQQPEVKVVSVRAGRTTYVQNKSYINIPFTSKDDAMPSNHSYAKALAYVEYGATFNDKGPNQLKGYDTLPLYDYPWNNEAYTRACYYYPYSNVRTYIVCSPKRGKERRATGHSSAIENWVYYDGYYFTRLENNGGNKYNPWTEEELTVPNNLGIYDESSNKFEENYDPRFTAPLYSKDVLIVMQSK
ncbi:MAG: hypothetical protein J6V44_03710 [Methanobrevibacter sp.]|nr:hypothetical protein [Methanobrevibacter sp.]